MGYGPAALEMLGALVGDLPPNGAMLELGQQNIEPGVPHDAVLNCARKIHRDEAAAKRVAGRYDGVNRCPISEIFRDSPYRYRCLDLYPGDFTIVADLNAFSVPRGDHGTFDLITNLGTTEHVTDQVNAFRVMHDYLRIGGSFIHIVPFAGYFNHGLYNYHPVFFVFLAAANEYEIMHMTLSGPDLPYTIPQIVGVFGSENWDGRIVDSGNIGCRLRKVNEMPFRLFTDFDQAVMGRLPLPSPWAEMVRKRHDEEVEWRVLSAS